MQKRISRHKLQNLTVYTIDRYEYFSEVIKKRGVNAIVFPSQASAMAEKERLIEYCIKEHIRVFILPQMNEVSEDGAIHTQIREIRIEDLLGREEIKINMEEIKGFLGGKRVMVTKIMRN